MEEKSIEELSPRGEIFRSKLIEDFQLLDILGSKGNIEVPRYHSNEIQGKLLSLELFQRILKPFILPNYFNFADYSLA